MDETEIAEWVTGCQHQLLRSAYLITGDQHRAEDLVQDALVKVAVRWSRLRDGNPTAYARTVIAHENISWWRRRRRETVSGTVRLADQPPVETEDQLVVRRALARLTDRQRRVVVLRHFDDLSERETAEILGVSIGTVKSQNAAALARLREGAPELLDLIGGTR